MDDNFDELVIDLRANTDRFNADLEGLRSTLDHSLIGGFDRAGSGELSSRSVSTVEPRGSRREPSEAT